MKLIARVRAEFGIRLPLWVVFQCASVAELAGQLDGRLKEIGDGGFLGGPAAMESCDASHAEPFAILGAADSAAWPWDTEEPPAGGRR